MKIEQRGKEETSDDFDDDDDDDCEYGYDGHGDNDHALPVV